MYLEGGSEKERLVVYEFRVNEPIFVETDTDFFKDFEDPLINFSNATYIKLEDGRVSEEIPLSNLNDPSIALDASKPLNLW